MSNHHWLSQSPVKTAAAKDEALAQEAEEAESDRMVWESGRSVPGWGPSEDRLDAGER
jgi:hypothetical protein